MLLPACPPGAVLPNTSVRSPSDAPYPATASPAGDECLQDDVAGGRALVQNPAQGIARHLVHLGVAAGDRADHRRIAGQMRHVTGELAFAVDRDGLRLIAGMIHDLHLAGLDDEEFEVAVADREQRLPVAVRLRRDTAATAQIVDE